MYVIKKDGIKRYVGEIKKVPNDTIKNNNWIGNHYRKTLLWNFKVPEGITMLKLNVKKDIFIKVRPLQEIVITGDASSLNPSHPGRMMMGSYLINQHYVAMEYMLPISISFSKEINSYSGNDILDISNEENQRQ